MVTRDFNMKCVFGPGEVILANYSKNNHLEKQTLIKQKLNYNILQYKYITIENAKAIVQINKAYTKIMTYKQTCTNTAHTPVHTHIHLQHSR